MGKSEGDSQGWLVTYSDLVTLILTFFVLLYTMTSGVEKTSFNSFIQYFQKNAGFLPESQAAVESIENKIEPEQLEQMMEEQMERWKPLRTSFMSRIYPQKWIFNYSRTG